MELTKHNTMDYGVAGMIGRQGRVKVYKNYEALTEREFAALYSIELVRSIAEKVYYACQKRKDLFKFKDKKFLHCLINENGNSFRYDAANVGGVYNGVVRTLNMLYRINFSERELCSMADMADYFDTLVKPELNNLHKVYMNIIGSSPTVTKNHGLLIELFDAYITSIFCSNIADRVSQTTITEDGRPATVLICRQPHVKGSHSTAIEISGDFARYITNTVACLMSCVLKKEGFNFDIDSICDRMLKVIDAVCNTRNCVIAAAFGGVDLINPDWNGCLVEDNESLVKEVISRYESEDMKNNKANLKALFESKGWNTKMVS